MFRKRQHERLALTADVIIQPGDPNPTRFAGRVFNLSEGGAAIFSEYFVPPGKLLALEVILPIAGVGIRRVVLYGVIRHAKAQGDGNILRMELQTGEDAGDHAWYAQYLRQRAAAVTGARPGFTLTEASITVIIVCVLVTMAAPIYTRAIEQARVDAAASTLRSIWSAQRIYWLEYRTFAPSLSTLESLDLVDSGVANSPSNPASAFVYQIGSAGADSFTATAMRNGSGVWIGQLQVNEIGQLSGSVTGRGVVITPPS